MGNVVVVAVLIVVVAFCLRSSVKHFKGEGGCCGGGSSCSNRTSNKRKRIGTPISKRIIEIEGMHCSHCRSSVERELNAIDGVLAKVNLNKGQAAVSMDRKVDDETLIQAVVRAGFEVTGIK